MITSNSSNDISDGSNSIGRSMSSARFQIAKVSDDDPCPKKLLGKAISTPISKSNQLNWLTIVSSIWKDISTSSLNAPKKKVFFEHDSSTSNAIENRESGNYDTIDALPHIDHYRNIFSFTSSEPKSRPTLEVLHGTVNTPSKYKSASTFDFSSEMIMLPNEQPAKTDIVKFGWIVGVLVCVFDLLISNEMIEYSRFVVYWIYSVLCYSFVYHGWQVKQELD